MTNLEKIKAEISSILEEYKQRFPINKEDKTDKKTSNIISESDILRNPPDIKSDLSYDIHKAADKHLEMFGNDNEPEINKHIETSLNSFSEFWNVRF